MSRLALRVVAVVGVIGLLGIGSYAIAGAGSKNFEGNPFKKQPRRTPGHFHDRERRLLREAVSDDGTSIHYRLSYQGLEGAVTQSHVHFGKACDQRRHLVLAL